MRFFILLAVLALFFFFFSATPAFARPTPELSGQFVATAAGAPDGDSGSSMMGATANVDVVKFADDALLLSTEVRILTRWRFVAVGGALQALWVVGSGVGIAPQLRVRGSCSDQRADVTMVTRVPRPSIESIRARQPWASATRRTNASPSPDPVAFVV